jgi:hypothetical protein
MLRTWANDFPRTSFHALQNFVAGLHSGKLLSPLPASNRQTTAFALLFLLTPHLYSPPLPS